MKIYTKENVEQFLRDAENGEDCFLEKVTGYEASVSLKVKHDDEELDELFAQEKEYQG
jgi:hypothetical protein